MGSSSRALTDVKFFLSIDGLAWIFAIPLAAWLRYEFNFAEMSWPGLIGFGLLGALAQILGEILLGKLRGRNRLGTFHEIKSLAFVTFNVAIVITLCMFVLNSATTVPRSTAILAAPLAIIGMLATRFMGRAASESQTSSTEDAKRTVVYGAGYLGEVIVRRMQTDTHSNYTPVAILDDDPHLKNRLVRGIRVAGNFNKLPEIVEKTGASELVIAIGSADATLVRATSDTAKSLGLQVRVLPPLEGMMERNARLSDLRAISIEDLIGRHPVETDIESIAGYVTGKRVLITGAGGSIGSELCRQISRLGPAELVMLDRDETGLQEAQIGVTGHGLLHTKDVVLADIREQEVLEKIFSLKRPQVVYHAAALKHLPMLEQYPEEGWKTNVLGTLNVLRAAEKVGVETFINVSTDKAANPSSVLGNSKRIAEQLTAWMAENTGHRYLSVRFGNVIGSRGSMLPTFRALIERGGPLTVTHPDVTRYFMTIPEACQLVVQAGAIGSKAEVLILDMGDPVKILDIAKRLIEMSGRDIEITFTGLRSGEKLHEELVGAGETGLRLHHPKISHAKVQGLNPSHLEPTKWLEQIVQGRCESN